MPKQEKQALLPKRRFPEFREAGEWEADALGKVAVFVNEKIPVAQVALENYVSTENILQDFGGVARASKLPTTGTVTRFRPHDTLVSNIRPYLKKVWVADKEGGASNDVIVIRAKQRLLTQYFSFLLKNDAFIDYVMTGAKGVKMPRGDVGSMKVYPAFYPSKPEQQKIADCLASLDDLITLEAQQLDTLKTHKKGLMQQLFPTEGEILPKLRFPEFRDAGEWCSDSLGAIFDTSSGGTPDRTKNEYWNGSIPWITTSLVDFNIITEAVEFITDAGLSNSSAKVFPEKTILVAMYGQGKTRGQVALLGIKAATNQACAAILPREKIDPRFVFLNLCSRYEEMRRLSNSGGQENLSQGLIQGLQFSYPEDKDEQQRIADCLASLDDLITAQTQKIAALKIHKKGLMQQLFPDTATTPPLRGTPPREGNKSSWASNSPPVEGWQAKPDGVVK